MQNFRTKLIGFAGAAVVFTGIAYGQASCSSMATIGTPTNIRSEGQTELLPSLVLTCTSTVGSTALTIQLYTQPGLSFTGALNSGSTTVTEAIATSGAVNPPAAPVAGTAGNATAGNALTFSTTSPVAAGAFFVRLDNVRVNASALNVAANSAPTLLNTVAYVQGGTTVSTTANTPTLTAFVTNSFSDKYGSDSGYVYTNKFAPNVSDSAAGVTTNGATNTYSVCASTNNSSTTAVAPNFFVQITEAFNNAFKTKTDELSSVTGVPGGGAIGVDAVNSGTRMKVVFSNVPAGFNLYVPLYVKSTGVGYSAGAVIQAQISETAGSTGNGATPATAPAQFANPNVSAVASTLAIPAVGGVAVTQGYYLVPASGGTATVVYEEVVDDLANADNFSIPVYFQVPSNTVSTTAASVTVQASLGPITSSTTIPSFAVGSSSGAPVTLINFSQCQTSLLFPFVTNANGFETGIAISNTSKDPFGDAANQNGLCQISYYGQGATPVYSTTLAPNPNEGGNAQYLSGESYAFTLTQALQQPTATSGAPANPATFTGYLFVNCKFQYAHGFAYILYGNLGSSTSDTMGYIATVLTGRNTSAAEGTAQ